MNIQQTLSIIKPDATKRNIIGKILSKLESSGLKIIAQKKIQLTEYHCRSWVQGSPGRGFEAQKKPGHRETKIRSSPGPETYIHYIYN